MSSVAIAIKAISILTSDPRLAGGGMHREKIAESLDLLAEAIRDGDDQAVEELKEALVEWVDNNIQPRERHFRRIRSIVRRAKEFVENVKDDFDEKPPADPETPPTEPPTEPEEPPVNEPSKD